MCSITPKPFSAEQSLCYGTKLLKCEEIIKIVEKVWKSKDDAVALSRGWMSHHQVIAATLEMKGDNTYLKQKGGLYFGIRTNFYPNEDNTGVLKIDELEQETSAADQITNERIRKGLKHKIPLFKDLKEGQLTREQIGFFHYHLDHEKMDDEIWQTLLDDI